MNNGLPTQTVPASTVSFSPSRPPVILDRISLHPVSATNPLRDNLRERAHLLSRIAEVAASGDEDDVLGLAASLASARNRAKSLHLSPVA